MKSEQQAIQTLQVLAELHSFPLGGGLGVGGVGAGGGGPGGPGGGMAGRQ